MGELPVLHDYVPPKQRRKEHSSKEKGPKVRTTEVVRHLVNSALGTGTANTLLKGIALVSQFRPEWGMLASDFQEGYASQTAMKAAGKDKSEIRAFQIKHGLKTLGRFGINVVTFGLAQAVPGVINAGKYVLEGKGWKEKGLRLGGFLGYGALTTGINLAATQALWSAGAFALLPGAVLPVAGLIATRQILNYGIHKLGEAGNLGENVKKVARPARQLVSAGLALGTMTYAVPGITDPIVPSVDLAHFGFTNHPNLIPIQQGARNLYDNAGQALINLIP
jgi:hypothetical protein